jgi:hypothetical protein
MSALEIMDWNDSYLSIVPRVLEWDVQRTTLVNRPERRCVVAEIAPQ